MKRLAIAMMLMLTACASHSTDTATFNGHGITFLHPETWRAHTFDEPRLVAYLGQQSMHAPCANNSCVLPVETLRPNSVLIAVYDGPKGRVAKTNLHVGGQPAHKTVWHNGCIGLKADKAITVRFDNPAHTTTYTVNACIRGDVAHQTRQLDALLRSLTFSEVAASRTKYRPTGRRFGKPVS